MVSADFADSAVNDVIGAVVAVLFVVMICWAFHDLIFGMIGEMRRSWNQNVRGKKE